MKRRERPPEPEPPVDAAEVRALVTELYEVDRRGEQVHGHPAGYRLAELAGVMAYYRAALTLANPDDPEELEAVVAAIVELAPRWKASQNRQTPRR